MCTLTSFDWGFAGGLLFGGLVWLAIAEWRYERFLRRQRRALGAFEALLDAVVPKPATLRSAPGPTEPLTDADFEERYL